MPLVLADRVRDTTTTTGTGTVTLSGTAPTGYQNFSVIGNGNTTYYTINAGSQWEVGVGTYSSTGPTLARTTVLESSNANALVDFAAGVKDVFVTYPADKSVNYDESNNVGIGTTTPSQKLDVNGSINAGTTNGVALFMANSSAIRNTATAGNTMFFDSGVGTGSTTGDFQFRSTASFTTRMYINGATGSVGIGTTSPARLFEVTATGTNIPARLGNSQGNLDIGGSDGVVVNIDTRSWAMGLQTGGTERMRITTAGLVGIGTSAPASRLDIGSGDLRFSGTGQRILGDFSNATIANRLAIQTTTASSATVIPIIPSAAGLNVGINLETDPTFTSGNVGQIVVVAGQEFRINSGNRGAGAYLPMTFYTNGSERMRITTAGLVQINTTSGAGWLTANSSDGAPSLLLTNSANSNPYLQFANGNFIQGISDGTLRLRTTTASAIVLDTNSAERMRITDAGNVGIGTSSPGTRLQVRDTAAPSGFSSTAVRVSRDNYGADFIGYIDQGVGHGAIISTVDNGTPTERMRITSAGNVGIGTSSPAGRLDVVSTSAGGASFMRVANGSGAANSYAAISLDPGNNGFNTRDAQIRAINNGSNQISLTFLTSNAGTPFEAMRITNAGNVGIGTTSPSERLDTGTGNTRTQALVVSGDQHLIYSASATELGIRIGASGPYYGIGDVGGSSMRLNSASGGPLLLAVAGNEAVRVDGARNVSIGTTAGNSRLRVVAGANVNAPILGNVANYSAFFSNTDAGYGLGIGTNAADGHVWLQAQRSDSAVAYNLTMQEAGGSVGIGLTTPASLLHVKRGSNAIEVYPAGTWATRVINATDASGENGLLVGNRWAATTSTVFEAGSIFGGGTGSWRSFYRIDGVGNSIWANEGTERMRLDTSGNVGIGTSSPGGRLDVRPSTNNIVQIKSATHSTLSGLGAAVAFSRGNDGIVDLSALFSWNNGGLAMAGREGLAFATGGATSYSATVERMRIDSSGNVGIGTTSPGVRLDVAGGSIRVGNTHAMTFRNAAGTGTATYTLQSDDNFVVYNAAGTPIQSFSQGAAAFAVYGGNANNRMVVDSGSNINYWIVNGSERARINSSGEFLIGTTSGGRTVCINASDNWMRMSNPSRAWLIGPSIGTGFNIYDETAGATRLTVDSSGSTLTFGLLVGRNTVGSNVNTNNDTGSFSVRGDGSNAASMSFHRTGAYAINMGLGTDAVFRIGGWSASSNCFQMDGSGNLTMLGNVTAYSDARIKKDVETIGSALDLVSKMRGVRYTRIDSGKRGVGVIAQEMLEVLPEVVQQGVGDDDTLSVAYGNLVGVLIEAVKELTARVAELERK